MLRIGGLLVMFLAFALPSGPLSDAGPLHPAQRATPEVGSRVSPAHLGGALPGDPRIQLVQITDGLIDPVSVAVPPDGSGRLFVVERQGRIRVVDRDGRLLDKPFLDLEGRVLAAHREQGLLGLAFHPDYASNGRFFAAFTELIPNGDTIVMEFRTSADDPSRAATSGERLILAVDQPFSNHNGGTIRFGPDGYLYIALGDGGWSGDPFDNAQNRFSLLGKILRIDAEPAGGQPYGIPPDNPFTGLERHDNPYPGGLPAWGSLVDEAAPTGNPVREEIWASGLRNPWQFSFDPETGDLYLPDVGDVAWEEINVQRAGMPGGQNYGWDWLEGAHCFPKEIIACPGQQVGVLPMAEYQHGVDGCAIIGIGVYRGEEIPALDGVYVSADYCTGKVRGLKRDAAGRWVFQDLLDTRLLISGAGQDEAGNLYVTALGSASEPGAKTGTLWRLVSADRVPPGARIPPLDGPETGSSSVTGGGNEADVRARESMLAKVSRDALIFMPATPLRTFLLTIADNYTLKERITRDNVFFADASMRDIVGYLCENKPLYLPLHGGDAPLGLAVFGLDPAQRGFQRIDLCDGPEPYCAYTMSSGWYYPEASDVSWWRWSSGRGETRVLVQEDIDAAVSGLLLSAQEGNRVDIVVNGREQGRLDALRTDPQPFGPIRVQLRRGENVIEFRAHNPAVAVPPDPRPLSMGVMDLSLEAHLLGDASTAPCTQLQTADDGIG